MSAATPPVDESEHFDTVIQAMREYKLWMSFELERRQRHLNAIPDEQKALLPASAFQPKFEALQLAVDTNQDLFDAIVSMCAQADGKVGDRPESKSHHFSKLKGTLHQFYRDWSADGKEERIQSYMPLLRLLTKYLPVTPENRHKQRVLVPGAGLGRLLYECVRAGYATQGNEFDYFMLTASNVILNMVRKPSCIAIHPWIHNPSNQMRPEDSLRRVLVPDVTPHTLMEADSDIDMSMIGGEFTHVYGEQSNCWDAVVTCFFIDTAPNVLDFLKVIHKILKPGGYWINLGPLLYHWQDPPGDTTSGDERYSQSVELAYSEIRYAAVKMGFKFSDEGINQCVYTANRLSLMNTTYKAVTFVAQKPATAAAAAPDGSTASSGDAEDHDMGGELGAGTTDMPPPGVGGRGVEGQGWAEFPAKRPPGAGSPAT